MPASRDLEGQRAAAEEKELSKQEATATAMLQVYQEATKNIQQLCKGLAASAKKQK
ncbi:hypothetical protein BOX15_Mlig015197g1 [Macrostomum lignano]|uniref:Uncharacterized protein n=1 Tax=Macrostomum lignano TaxID=282301 RepID=A0A267DWH7_9PLAT|nr:hypothetical protein BOX15_Mlig015197g1 [Macrostomum lignano]